MLTEFYPELECFEKAFCGINAQSKIIDLGCGLSDKISDINLVNNNFHILMQMKKNYVNFKCSDINLHPVIFQSVIPNYTDTMFKCDNFFLNGSKIKKYFNDFFIPLNLKNDQTSEKFDLIILRYVLHFPEFKDARLNIIKSLVNNNLTENGKLFIYSHANLPINNTYHCEFSKNELIKLRKNFNYKGKSILNNNKDNKTTFDSLAVVITNAK